MVDILLNPEGPLSELVTTTVDSFFSSSLVDTVNRHFSFVDQSPGSCRMSFDYKKNILKGHPAVPADLRVKLKPGTLIVYVPGQTSFGQI